MFLWCFAALDLFKMATSNALPYSWPNSAILTCHTVHQFHSITFINKMHKLHNYYSYSYNASNDCMKLSQSWTVKKNIHTGMPYSFHLQSLNTRVNIALIIIIYFFIFCFICCVLTWGDKMKKFSLEKWCPWTEVLRLSKDVFLGNRAESFRDSGA